MPGRSVAAVARDQRQDGRIERERDAGAVAGLAIGAERPAMGERRQPGQGQRQHPIARPTTRIGDEPHATGVVLVARVVERHRHRAASAGTVAIALVGVHGDRHLRWDDAAAVERIDSGRRVNGVTTMRRRPAGPGRSRSGRSAPPSGLVGGLAVDGEIETHLLGFRLDPDPEQEVDDLDDDDGADAA